MRSGVNAQKFEFNWEGLPSLEEDYPDQLAEYRTQKLEEALVEFVFRVAGEVTVSLEEEDAVVSGVAAKLFQHFQSDIAAKLLKSRLAARFPTLLG